MERRAIWFCAGVTGLWAAAALANTGHVPGPAPAADVMPHIAAPHAAVAKGPAPAELPPEDFTGTQYIDSTGCVFLRGSEGWTPRLGPDDAPVCGWPPSRAARRTDPDTISILTPDKPPAPPPGPEEVLMSTLAEGLRDGEWTDDPHPPEQRAPAPTEPVPTEGPLADLAAMVAAAPAVNAALTLPGARDDRLCRLLGGEAARPGAPTLGSDPTSGFCPGLTPIVLPGANHTAPESLLALGANAAAMGEGHDDDDMPTVGKNAVAPAPDTLKTSPVKVAADENAKPEKPAASRPEARPAARVSEPAGLTPEMIPASARFVMVGAFDSTQAAQTVSDRIAGLGYPVARGRIAGGAAPAGRAAATVVLAGPFGDRRAIVAALNDLRGRGYAASVAQ